ncbi:MAG TPA: glycosyltransferase family 4 protein [Candidatus Paceibacterota bacterium]|nr:glycosyltransferase family 4 protein [Candidatus Paceibacterota bacterium]
MKVLFATIYAPSLKKGAPVRIYNLIKQTVHKGIDVDLITLADDVINKDELKRDLGIKNLKVLPIKKHSMFQQFIDVVFFRVPPYFREYRESSLGQEVLKHIKEYKPDIIQLELLHTLYAIAPILKKAQKQGVKIVLDAHNVEYKAFRDGIQVFSLPKRMIGKYLLSNLLRLEISGIKISDLIFTCSDEDKGFFKRLCPDSRLEVIPNGVDLNYFMPQPFIAEPVILFAGGMYYPPNDDALSFYFSEIHNKVKKEIPNVKIILLGGELNSWLKGLSLKYPEIITPGLVPDVRDYISKSRVCISPMRRGSGTSLKILEYMGSGKTIVATKVGMRGIKYINGKNVLIADSAQDFSAYLIQVLKDEVLAKTLGNNARKNAEEFYGWDGIVDNVIFAYKRMLNT